jgi:hypothetical protein
VIVQKRTDGAVGPLRSSGAAKGLDERKSRRHLILSVSAKQCGSIFVCGNASLHRCCLGHNRHRDAACMGHGGCARRIRLCCRRLISGYRDRALSGQVIPARHRWCSTA